MSVYLLTYLFSDQNCLRRTSQRTTIAPYPERHSAGRPGPSSLYQM